MLHDFLASNRMVLIDRCHSMVAARLGSRSAADPSSPGIPVFLDQLIQTLSVEKRSENGSLHASSGSATQSDSAVGDTARRHGRDLLTRGFTLEQVVRDYGNVCQAVTSLAVETHTPISVDEFRSFNRCLDNAIAGAVSEYAKHSTESPERVSETLNARLGPLAHELRNYLNTALLVVSALKMGKVGISGATGGVLDRCLLGMRNLIDRAVGEVRVTGSLPPRREIIAVAKLVADVTISASFEALERKTRLMVAPVAEDVAVYADPEMLAAAIANLLQNAFKFTKRHTEVQLRAHVVSDRVLIDVEDQCGGLPAGAVDTIFQPFAQNGEDRSGLGLGLDISLRGVEANDGVLRVRDIPGTGCIFTIDLPLYRPGGNRHAPEQGLPEQQQGSPE